MTCGFCRGALSQRYCFVRHKDEVELKAQLQQFCETAAEMVLLGDGVPAELISIVRVAVVKLPCQLRMLPTTADEAALGAVVRLPLASQEVLQQ